MKQGRSIRNESYSKAVKQEKEPREKKKLCNGSRITTNGVKKHAKRKKKERRTKGRGGD